MENKEINYCPKCGNKLTGNEKFCSVCGSPVLDFFLMKRSK
ncbi:zinc-ribbon domain-containing protein [Clostridium fessum]